MFSLADELGGGLDDHDHLGSPGGGALDLELEMEMGADGGLGGMGGIGNLADELGGGEMGDSLEMEMSGGMGGGMGSLADELGGGEGLQSPRPELGSLANELDQFCLLSLAGPITNGTSTLDADLNYGGNHRSDPRSGDKTPRTVSQTDRADRHRDVHRDIEREIGDALLVLSETLASTSRFLSLLRKMDEPVQRGRHGVSASGTGSASGSSARNSLNSPVSPVSPNTDTHAHVGGLTLEARLQAHLTRLSECERTREEQVRELVAQVRDAEGVWDELGASGLGGVLDTSVGGGVQAVSNGKGKIGKEARVIWAGEGVGLGVVGEEDEHDFDHDNHEDHDLDERYEDDEDEDDDDDELEPPSPTPQPMHLDPAHTSRHHRRHLPSHRSPLSSSSHFSDTDPLLLSPVSPSFSLSHSHAFSNSHAHAQAQAQAHADLDLVSGPLLSSLTTLTDTLSLNLAISSSSSRSLRGVRAAAQAWREREAVEDAAWEGVRAWEAQREDEGMEAGKGVVVRVKKEMEGVVIGFEGVLEEIEKRMRGLASVRG